MTTESNRIIRLMTAVFALVAVIDPFVSVYAEEFAGTIASGENNTITMWLSVICVLTTVIVVLTQTRRRTKHH